MSDYDFLGNSSAEAYQRGRRIVLVGGSKIGKTCLAARFPDPYFICDFGERGLEDLKVHGLVRQDIQVCPPIMDWEGLMKITYQLAYQDHPHKTIVLEGITGFELFCFRYCCREDYNNNWTKYREGFYNFMNGPKTAAKKYWPEFIDRLEMIANRGVHVILTGHTTVKPKNTVQEEYDAEVVYCDKETWANTHKWAEAIFNMAISTEVQNGKASGEPKRVIHADKQAGYDGGNRYGVTMPIQCGANADETYANVARACKFDPATGFFV